MKEERFVKKILKKNEFNTQTRRRRRRKPAGHRVWAASFIFSGDRNVRERGELVCVVGILEREVKEGYEEKNRSSTFISFFWTGFFLNKPDFALLNYGLYSQPLDHEI